ncbi:hypothetical protein ALC56_12129 [Trachymyrmex septentrionalis]|uniref:Uncharacterized protein n=1 Tax=Trachymyrmex septentrionalis TaxID=34720 RepID=A0A195EZS8_9HYME|nr:hypothetical protein ALC56_12129 [Trachymyrmex septentrionalis]
MVMYSITITNVRFAGAALPPVSKSNPRKATCLSPGGHEDCATIKTPVKIFFFTPHLASNTRYQINFPSVKSQRRRPHCLSEDWPARHRVYQQIEHSTRNYAHYAPRVARARDRRHYTRKRVISVIISISARPRNLVVAFAVFSIRSVRRNARPEMPRPR